MIATAIIKSHMRMRPQCCMLTISDSAPMVQKFDLLATTPNTNAKQNPQTGTYIAGLPMVTKTFLLNVTLRRANTRRNAIPELEATTEGET